MMKKLFVICSWALLLGGCKSESGASDPDGDKPVPPPPPRPNCCKRSKT